MRIRELKNKFSIIFSIIFFIILVFSLFLIPGITVNIIWAKAKQPIEKPEGMNDWIGFFDPQIKIYATVTDANIILRPDECTYIFPTFTLAYRAVCEAEENIDIIDAGQQFAKCVEYDRTPRKTQNIEFICARQMSVCGFARIYGQALGCLRIPMAPPPPPFYDMLPPVTIIKITPDKTSTFFEPRIRAVLSGSTSGGKKQSLLCDITKTEPTISMVNYNNKNYEFATQIKSDKICGSQKSGLEGHIENCFLRPGMPRPKIIKNGDPKQRAISFNIETKPGEQQLITLREGEIENITKLSLLNPEINYSNRRFKGEAICKSLDISKAQDKPACPDNAQPKYNVEEKDLAKRILTCGTQPQNCGEGYQLKLQYKQAKNSASNVLCLNGWSPMPAEYLLAVDHDNKTYQFKETEYAFIPYELKGEKWEKNKSAGNLSIKTSTQEDLDTADNIGQGIYAFSDGRQTYRYERAVYEDNRGATTSFISLSQEKVFYLPADEGKNKYTENICGDTLCYAPTDPYLQGLCAFIKPVNQITCFNSSSTEEKQKEKKQCRIETVNVPSLGIDAISLKPDPKDPKSPKEKPGYGDYGLDIKKAFENGCDFLTLEAIGGGASGDISFGGGGSNIFSGSSGAYTAATIHRKVLDNYRSIAVFIGKGGEAANATSDGGKSEIYLCTEGVKRASKENCKLLLSAEGGSKARGAAQNTEEKAFGKAFKDKFLYQRNTAGVKGCVPRQNTEPPLVPVPDAKGHAVDPSDYYCASGDNYKEYKETNCYQQQEKEIIPGQGGCVSGAEGIVKNGYTGMVRITCEQWGG